MSTHLWWIRRDLRLEDNPTLAAALAQATPVVPVFILDDALLRAYQGAPHRQAFLWQALGSLAQALQTRGAQLVVRVGPPLAALTALVTETEATAIYAEEDYSPYARQRDAAIAAALPLHLVHGLSIHHPTAVRKKDGTPYTVFTPFSRAWKAQLPPTLAQRLPAPAQLPTVRPLPSHPIPVVAPLPLFLATAPEAQRRLAHFCQQHLENYSVGRNRLDAAGTSTLSPYLRFGLISARTCVVAALAAIHTAPTASARQSAEAWLNELIWREFYQSILYHFPAVLHQAFRPALRHIQWGNEPALFQAWCAGATGYPVVDAAMRQLAATGWMHNRARMIVASFLVKHLLINWQWGERWFMEQLVDGDPAANNGGWQWTAGVGTDAAPYFRVFNPVLQGQKFDPHGTFVRQWLPTLNAVPDKFIHAPWEMPSTLQNTIGCVIGQHYPAPIVQHALARARVLAAYQAAAQQAQ